MDKMVEIDTSFLYFIGCFLSLVSAQIDLKSETHELASGPVVQIKCAYNVTGGTDYTFTWTV